MATPDDVLVEINQIQTEIKNQIEGKSFLGAFHAAKCWVVTHPDQEAVLDALISMLDILNLRNQAVKA